MEWVNLEELQPEDNSWCIAIEKGKLAGDVVYWIDNGFDSEFVGQNYTHWMYHPRPPDE